MLRLFMVQKTTISLDSPNGLEGRDNRETICTKCDSIVDHEIIEIVDHELTPASLNCI
jgi:hypothetical protein